MAYPAALDSITQPGSGDLTTSPSHAATHDAEIVAIQALEAKVGITASTPTASKVLRSSSTGTSVWGQAVLTTDVTGTLPTANGGNGTTSVTGTGSAVFSVTPTLTSGGTWSGSPTINTPTITTPVIASFASANHNHSNSAGGGALASATVVPNNLIASSGASWTPQSWTPTWTNLTIGDAVVVGKTTQIGKKLIAELSVVWGAGTSASGIVSFSLPFTSISYPGTSGTVAIGYGGLYDASASTLYDAVLVWSTTTKVIIAIKPSSGAYTTQTGLTDTTPVTWTTSDEWNFTLIYTLP